jgi:hypothetical protein
MKDRDIAKIDRLALHMIRQGKERSRALPAKAYGDPAKYIKYQCEREMEMKDKELNAFCQAWAHWCWTRRYFIRPGTKNVLARMQPSKSGKEPNAELSSELNFFNMAVHSLADMQDHRDDAACFVSYYWDRESNIKAIAAKMGIGRQTYYDRMYRFARKALSMSHSLRRVHLQAMDKATAVID